MHLFSELASKEVVRRLLMAAMLAGVFLLSASAVAYISFRGHTVEVPNVVGKSESDATEELQGSGLRIKVTGKAYNDKVATSAVIEQSPLPGSTVKTGQFVRVSISLGPQIQAQQ